jgi:competence protein ComEA
MHPNTHDRWRLDDGSDHDEDEVRDAAPRPTSSSVPAGRSPAVLIATVVFAAVSALGVGAVLILSAPQPSVVIDASASERPERTGAFAARLQLPDATLEAEPVAAWLVDVEGAVARPGVYRLRPGSRIGDAVSAAGGYGADVDAELAAATLNLAQPLQDGQKVHIPRRGEQAPAAAATSGSGSGASGAAPGGTEPGGSGGGLIDLNRATSAELEELPGIGPATAGKIIAAREEAPFTSVDELRERSVLGPATFEKVRDLVTVGQ